MPWAHRQQIVEDELILYWDTVAAMQEPSCAYDRHIEYAGNCSRHLADAQYDIPILCQTIIEGG